jgi:membrane protease YdiL (CAAX protease family)
MISIVVGAVVLTVAAQVWSISEQTWQGISIGFALAAIFVSAGFLSFYKGIKSEEKTFNLILFGSIFARLMLAAVALVVLIKFTEVDQRALLISMFTWYLILQIGEIIGFHKIMKRNI